MPNTREKLIELFRAIAHKNCFGSIENIADYLIANGVTLATDNNAGSKWISVKDRLPENRDDVLLCRKWWNEIQKPQMGWYNEVSGAWFDLANSAIHNVTHWMPLPEPPKGE